VEARGSVEGVEEAVWSAVSDLFAKA
jgi:hypothetical protein